MQTDTIDRGIIKATLGEDDVLGVYLGSDAIMYPVATVEVAHTFFVDIVRITVEDYAGPVGGPTRTGMLHFTLNGQHEDVPMFQWLEAGAVTEYGVEYHLDPRITALVHELIATAQDEG